MCERSKTDVLLNVARRQPGKMVQYDKSLTPYRGTKTNPMMLPFQKCIYQMPRFVPGRSGKRAPKRDGGEWGWGGWGHVKRGWHPDKPNSKGGDNGCRFVRSQRRQGAEGSGGAVSLSDGNISSCHTLLCCAAAKQFGLSLIHI